MAKQKKLDNKDKLPTLEELHQDLRLLKDGILQCPRKTESAFLDLSSLLICSLVASNAERWISFPFFRG